MTQFANALATKSSVCGNEQGIELCRPKPTAVELFDCLPLALSAIYDLHSAAPARFATRMTHLLPRLALGPIKDLLPVTDADEKLNSSCRVNLPRFDGRVTGGGCSRALASISWLWDKATGESHLLFATVDLVPDELPLVDCTPKRKPVSLGKKSDWRIYCADHQVASSDALQWYDGVVTRGEWAASWLDPQIKKPNPLQEILNEPRWPEMVSLENTTAVPFASKRPAATRVHHTLSTAGTARNVVTAEEMTILVDTLKTFAELDLEQSPHLWQSAHLFMPLPILRHVSSRLDSDEKSGDRAILLNLVPRLGAELDKLSVEVMESRPTGVRLLARGRAASMFLRVPLDEDVEQITIRVVHDELGLLVQEGPYTFLQGISMEMQLITEHRRIVIPERKNRPAENHKVPISGMKQMVLTGSERGVSASRLLYQATDSRRATTARSIRQMWFRNNAQVAEVEIRKVIGAAKTKVLLVDPYFTALGAKLYLPWVTGSGVQNEILTSSKGLREISLTDEGDEMGGTKWAKRELAHLEALSNELNHAVAARRVNSTLVKVMGGDSPAIHDRFLVVDESAWLLGSSLNSFGTRGTMMVELPSPEAVVPELVHVWKDPTSLDMGERIEVLRRQLQEPA